MIRYIRCADSSKTDAVSTNNARPKLKHLQDGVMCLEDLDVVIRNVRASLLVSIG